MKSILKKGIVYLLVMLMTMGVFGTAVYASEAVATEASSVVAQTEGEDEDIVEYPSEEPEKVVEEESSKEAEETTDGSDIENTSVMEEESLSGEDDSYTEDVAEEDITEETEETVVKEQNEEAAEETASAAEEETSEEKIKNAEETSAAEKTEADQTKESLNDVSKKVKTTADDAEEDSKEQATKEEETKDNEDGPITDIKLNVTEKTLATKRSFTLKATVTPSKTKEKVIWKSSNEKIATVDQNGKVTALTYGKVTITAQGEKSTKVKASCEIEVRFYDVNDESKYYFTPVYWAAEKGITQGFDNVYFGPNQTCTRRQMVTFLWRFAGKPSASGSVKFRDVKKNSSEGYKAIQWAVAKGIIKGYDDNTFRPNGKVIRKDALIMLYRLAGKPKASGYVFYTDVANKNYSRKSDTYKSIQWASNVGITKGYPDGNFRPDSSCTREGIVTFLYRYKDNKNKPAYLGSPEPLKGTFSGNSIKLSWKKVSGAESYVVYRYIYSKKKFEKIATVTSPSYTVTNIKEGDAHRFKVTAFKGNLRSDITDELKVACVSQPKLRSASANNSGITVKWDKVKGAKAYRVYRKTGKGGWSSVGVTKNTSFNDNKLKDRTKYTYTVRAIVYSAGKECLSKYDEKGKSATSKVMTHRGKMLAKAQDYSSSTGYLILVDCHANKVGVYTGRKGNWKEKFYWTCTSGAGDTPTVKGLFTLDFKQYTFGDAIYSVYYTSSFYGPYYFHSILYHAGTWNVLDGRLGQDLSQGCVRLAVENARWIYENIPVGTTVYTY